MADFSLPQSVESFLLRDLNSVAREIEMYPEDGLLWVVPPGLPNSGGTLALHLAGNLQHNVGALLGGTGFVRDRDREFAARDLPRADVIWEIRRAMEAVRQTLSSATDDQLRQPFPEPIRGAEVGTGEVLIQLAVHLGYHLGQINYHRRIVTGNSAGIGALDSGELSTASRPSPNRT